MEHSGSQYASDDFGPAHDAAVVAAKAARLRYVTDHWPGIVRERNGTRFVYRDSSDAAIADRAELARIKWIRPDPDGHIQATGRDARGRKQYRYYARWRSVRDDSVAVLVLRESVSIWP